MTSERVAIVGGGIAGLACARRLTEAGWEVEVFDKARRPGGRMSTRRVDGLTFDHGAPFFTAREPNFRSLVESWVEAGVAAPWRGVLQQLGGDRPDPDANRVRYVGVPTMSAIPRAMAEGISVSAGVRITEVSRVPTGFILGDTDGTPRRPFRRVIVATPAQQATNLLLANRQLAAAAERAAMEPCLAAMVAFDEPLDFEASGAFVNEGPLCWVGRQNAKPGRDPAEAWVLHANASWSAEHISESPDVFAPKLVEAFAEATGLDLPEPVHLAGHRWRYAKTGQPVNRGYLWDEALGLGACGDWCMGPRVEDAWRSGHALAGHILELAYAD